MTGNHVAHQRVYRHLVAKLAVINFAEIGLDPLPEQVVESTSYAQGQGITQNSLRVPRRDTLTA